VGGTGPGRLGPPLNLAVKIRLIQMSPLRMVGTAFLPVLVLQSFVKSINYFSRYAAVNVHEFQFDRLISCVGWRNVS